MKSWVLIFLTFIVSIPSYAQDNFNLPRLPDDSAIRTFTLANGVKCYLASNASGKGLMDISLVQRVDPLLSVTENIVLARDRFTRAKIGNVEFESFLFRNGILPDRNGYVVTKQGSVQYNFQNCSFACNPAVIDSTLTGVFSLMQIAGSQGQPSSSQALVVAGDFDEKALMDKFRLLSLACPAVAGEIPHYEYKWVPGVTNVEDAITFEGGPSSKVVVKFRGARTPFEYMTTVLPVISDKLAGELAWVLESRLYPVFRSKGIHVWISCRNNNSADGLSDEVIILTIYCQREFRGKVRDILRTELDRLMTYGLDQVEYTYARDAHRYKWLSESKRLNPSNSLLVKRCVSSFLYGASLSSEESKIQFAYRTLPDSVQTSLFNRYLRRKLVGTSRVDSTLAKSHPLTAREVTGSIISSFAPVVAFKPPKDKPEYLTGGLFWTFPNGINVVYKKMDTRGLLYYSYSSRGGRQWADPDYFTCLDGVYEESFSNYLSSQGIEMKLALNPCDVRMEGKVPEENVETLLHVLAALSHQKENEMVFSPQCYKLMVLVGNIDETSIKKMLSDQISALGSGGPWIAGTPVEGENEEEFSVPGIVSRHVSATIDVSTHNQATADIAGYALRDAIGKNFDGCGIQYVCRQSFSGFPFSRYNLIYGVRPLTLESFSVVERRLDESQSFARLSMALETLSSEAISAGALSAYKGMAKNAYKSYSVTPEYYLQIANSRYLDNKNPYANYLKVLDGITSEELRSFFASLL